MTMPIVGRTGCPALVVPGCFWCLRSLGAVGRPIVSGLHRLAAPRLPGVRIGLVSPDVLTVIGIRAPCALRSVVAGRAVPLMTIGHRHAHLGQGSVGGGLNRSGQRACRRQAGAAQYQPGGEGGPDLELHETSGPSRNDRHRGPVASGDNRVDGAMSQAAETLDERIVFVHRLLQRHAGLRGYGRGQFGQGPMLKGLDRADSASREPGHFLE